MSTRHVQQEMKTVEGWKAVENFKSIIDAQEDYQQQAFLQAFFINFYCISCGISKPQSDVKLNARHLFVDAGKLIGYLKKRIKPGGLWVFLEEENHFTQVSPVMAELRKRGVNIAVIANKNSLEQKVVAAGYYCISIPPLNILLYNTRFGKQFRKASSALQASINHDSTKLHRLSETIDRNYANYFLYVKRFAFMLEKYKPSGILIGYDIAPYSRILCELSRHFGIPTFMIQHGAINLVNPLFSAHIVDHYLLFGERAKHILNESECSVKSFHVVGAPYLDEYSQQPASTGNKAQAISKVLVAFSGPGIVTSEENHVRSIAILQDLLVQRPDINLYIKIHKKDNMKYYHKLSQAAPARVHYEIPSKSLNALDWIHYCDCIISSASTVILEALYLGKPALSLDVLGEYEDLDVIKESVVPRVSSPEMLDEVLNKMSANSYTPDSRIVSYVNQCFYRTTSAAENCSKTIEDNLKVIHERH